MAKTSLSLFLASLFLLACTSGFAQSKRTDANVAGSNDEKLFAADAATYVSGEKYALQWLPVQESDVLWRKRVHRTLDAAQDENQVLGPSKGKSFSTMLFDAVKAGYVKAYADPYYRKTLEADEVAAILALGQSTKFQLREDWLYVRDTRGLVGRIIGIAPLREEPASTAEKGIEPLFWIYYPELRPYLRSQEIEDGADVKNLDQWFECRRFASADVKTFSVITPSRMR